MKKHKGVMGELVIPLVTMFIVLVFIAAVLPQIKSVMNYVKVHTLSRKYVLKMESIGYMPPAMQTALRNDLTAASIGNVSLSGTTFTQVAYDADLYIQVAYDDVYKELDTSGGSITFVPKTRRVTVQKSTTSRH